MPKVSTLCSSTTPLFPSAVPETLDRKHFQQEGMRIHTSSVKGPPQVCARTSCRVASGDCHGNGCNCMVCVLRVGPSAKHHSATSK